MGSEAKRKTRPTSKILGRKSRVTKSMCRMIVSPSRNPVRKQPYELQISYHNLPVGVRQLQRKIKEHTKGGGRYKCAFVIKQISAKNKYERAKYGEEHEDKTIDDFWSHIVFTDEAHVDSNVSRGVIRRMA